MVRRLLRVVIAITMLTAVSAHAAFEDELSAVQQRWSAIRYQTTGDERKKQLEGLIAEADALKSKYGDKAASFLWSGVVRGSLAEAINGIGALSIVKEAKADFEKSIAMDPKADDAYAYGALGMMYAKVPGWPVAFGDEKKAKELLQKGLAASPNGMNINYFNAEFAFEDGDYQKAQAFIEKAAQATPPAPAEIWGGRQREIADMAAKIRKKLQ